MGSLTKVRKTQTVTSRVYKRLARAILQNELLPGEHLVAEALAERFGVSRTPVREALQILEHEGLVETVGSSGTFVTGLELSDLLRIFEFREAIELHALTLGENRYTSGNLYAWHEALNNVRNPKLPSEVDLAAEADLAFHRELVAFTGNGRMLQAWDRLAAQLRRFWVDGRTVPARAQSDIEECILIVEHLQRSDVGHATAVLRDHLSATRVALISWREALRQPSDSNANEGPTGKGGTLGE